MAATHHRTQLVWDDRFVDYDFGPTHPMGPIRLDLTVRLARSLGLLECIELISPSIASDELLATAHDPAYIAAVKAASAQPQSADIQRGLGTEDDPAFIGMHEASARIVQGTVDICEAVWSGEIDHGVNHCGGLHHAMSDHASGFCIYNDIVVGIRHLLDQGAERVAYLDVDVHHGDGVEAAFWNDPRVLTISVHESGRALFPGTGWPGDTGGAKAPGGAVNVALPPGIGDADWLRAIEAVAVPVTQAFAPDMIVSQHGCDSHQLDPLAHLRTSIDAQVRAAERVHALAHELCDGRWVALGGGGYELVDVVPRAWSHLIGIASHQPVPTSTSIPQEWLDQVREQLGREAPLTMGDLSPEELPIWVRPWSVGFNPESPIDAAIMATRQAVFPHYGLDPWFE